MSSRTYSSYTLSKAERQRIELELQRRIKEEQERQEQERKRREEEQRQKELAEEAMRLSLVSEFRARTGEYYRAYLGDRLRAVLRDAEDAPTHSGQMNELTSKAKSLLNALSSAHVDLNQIAGQIEKLEQESHSSVSRAKTGMTRHEAERLKKREKTMQLLEYLKNLYHAFPGESRQDFMKELDRINEAILLAEREKEFNLTGNYENLKWAKREMIHIMSAIPEKARKRNERHERLLGEIESLRVRLQTIHTLAVLDGHRVRSGDLLSELNSASKVQIVSNLTSLVDGLQKKTSELAAESEDAIQRQEERSHVMSIVTTTLQEMGYSILPIPTDSNPQPSHSARLYFRTPNREAVETKFGLDRSIKLEFMHVQSSEDAEDNSASQSELDEKSRLCCDHIDELNRRLRAMGITLNENWRVQPGTEEYKTLQVQAEVLEQFDADRRRPRGGHDQRARTQ